MGVCEPLRVDMPEVFHNPRPVCLNLPLLARALPPTD
jgi:hypothetical protein